MEVPKSLRKWMVIHFYVDYAFAVPFFFFPIQLAGLLGYEPMDPLSARLVSAALFGIGYSSLIAAKFDLEKMQYKLRWAVVWAGTATVGLFWSATQVNHNWGWVFAFIFLGFFILWSFYAIKLKAFDKI